MNSSSMTIIGLGAWLAYIWLMFYRSTAFTTVDSSILAYVNATYAVYTGVWFSTCLIVFFLAQRLDTICKRPRIIALFAGVATTGTLVFICTPRGPAAFVHFGCIIAGLLCGVGISGITLGWGEHLTTHKPQRVLVETSSAILSAIGLFFIAFFAIHAASVIMLALLPVLSGTLMALSAQGNQADIPSTQKPLVSKKLGKKDDATNVSKVPIPKRPACCLLIFGLSCGFLRGVGIPSYEPFGSELIIFFACIGIPVAIVSAYLRIRPERLNENKLLTFAALVTVAGFLALPTLGIVHIIVAAIAIGGAWLCVEMYSWHYLATVVERENGNPLLVFSFGRAMIQGGMFAGFMIGLATVNVVSVHMAGVFFVLSYAFVLVAVLALKTPFFNNDGRSDKNANSSDAVKLLASEYGLTPRETDVFELLVRGRSISSIEERLFISENTVKSHIKHIYIKFDVHSRKELLDVYDDYIQRT